LTANALLVGSTVVGAFFLKKEKKVGKKKPRKERKKERKMGEGGVN
jgi:hypothetical protein